MNQNQAQTRRNETMTAITIDYGRFSQTYQAVKFEQGWAYETCSGQRGLLSLGGVDQCCQPTLQKLMEITYGRYRKRILSAA